MAGLRHPPQKAAALDAYFAGDITREEMQSAKSQYDQQLADLQHRIAAAQEPSALDEAAIRQTLSALLSGETESDGLYKSILDRLTVFHDRHMELRLKELIQVFHFRCINVKQYYFSPYLLAKAHLYVIYLQNKLECLNKNMEVVYEADKKSHCADACSCNVLQCLSCFCHSQRDQY